MDATIIPKPGEGQPAPAKDAGSPGRKIGDLPSFQSPGEPGGSSAGRGPSPGGKKGPGKNKGGRPPKNLAGFPAKEIDQVVDDPEIEAAREEFEAVLIELLVATTENFADSRYELLKAEYPDAVARGYADKFLLTEKERKYFGGVAVRLWRKYLGDKYLFTDEGIAGVYCLKYLLRIWEPLTASRKIEAKINGKSSHQQSGLQSAPSAGDRSQPDRKEHLNGSTDSHTPSRVSTDL